MKRVFPVTVLALGASLASSAHAAPFEPIPGPALPGPIVILPWKDLSVSKIEVTQSMQFMGSATDADNSMPAVDRRATTVRVKVKVAGFPLFAPVAGVQGRLRVHQGATLLHDMLSDEGAISAPVSPDRNNGTHTLNFTFVPGSGPALALFGRTLTFTVTIDPFNTIAESNEANNESSMTKFFGCRRAPLVMGVPIDYQFAGETDPTTLGEPNPNLIIPGVGDAFLWGAYPFPEYTPGPNGRYRLVDGPALEWTQNVDTSVSALLAELDAQRLAMSPVPDHLYGWVRGNPISGNGWGMVGGGAAFGNTDLTRYQRTFAHEVGHNFGFTHNRADAGLFITTIDQTGWDVLDRLDLGRVKPTSMRDIMVPALLTHEAWVHPRTYRDVHDDVTNACLIVRPPLIDVIMVTGIIPIDPRDKWTVLPPFQVRSAVEIPKPAGQGRGRVRMLGADGRELDVRPFRGALASGDGENERAPTTFSVMVPAVQGAAAIEVMHDGQVVQVLRRSANAPKVTMLSPAPGPAGRQLVVAWRAEDADGDALEAMVRYSPDGGQTFIPLSGRSKANQLRVSTERLPASDKGMIQVLVTDGFNTSTAEVHGVALAGNRPPRVAITRPADGSVFPSGANVALVAAAHDPEDGEVAADAILWVSDRDGKLGTGAVLNTASLSRGGHLITAVATDAAGAQAQAAVKIAVR